MQQNIIQNFKGTLRGTLLQPDDPDYRDARLVWNGMIDRHPDMIAQCVGVADVMTCINFARENNITFSVRSGGHNVAGRSVCDGLVIDLSQMNAVHIDTATQTARVQPGATWGEFDHEAQAFGLATTGGVHSGTGVAGLTLGGGIGYLARKHGLTIDNLIGADVVTANGELIHVNETEHSDLFWALRGGGGNFGIVTSFEFQLHNVGPEVLTAQFYFPFENAADLLRTYRDFTQNVPDELSLYAMILHVPPVAPFPEENHGDITLAFVGIYAGDIEEGRAVLAPLDELDNPILKAVMPMPYKVMQSAFDAGSPDHARYYYKSLIMKELADEAIESIAMHGSSLSGPLTIVGIEPLGGAINRQSADATAFPHRNAAYNFSVWGGWLDATDDQSNITSVRTFFEEMASHAGNDVYSNYLSADEAHRVQEAFRGNIERLKRVKENYDPDNLFKGNLILDDIRENA